MIDLALIRKTRELGVYRLDQLGIKDPFTLRFYNPIRNNPNGWLIAELFDVVIDRTKYLYNIIPCTESEKAISHLEKGKSLIWKDHSRGILKVDVPGHIYQMVDNKGCPFTHQIKFIRRSGKAITYPTDWPGLQTQELFRAMIDHLMLRRWGWEAADYCRQALWEYEARAYRRKRQELNRDKPEHNGDLVFDYNWQDIDYHTYCYGLGEDGHIRYLEAEALYYLNFGGMGSEPIPGISPFAIENDPVYLKAIKNLETNL